VVGVSWLTELLHIGGRLSAGNSFAALRVFANYLNYGFNPNPFSLGTNDISFFGPPTGTEWGVQTAYKVNSAIQVAAGAFNTNANSANGIGHGTDFVLQEGNKGVLAIGEIDYLRNQGFTDKGKQGQYAIGHDSGTGAPLYPEFILATPPTSVRSLTSPKTVDQLRTTLENYGVFPSEY
jgi:carbohydrate-selective porin OprB